MIQTVVRSMEVSRLFEKLQQGDESAIAKIWSYFAADLAKIARQRLSTESKRIYDEDDACISAFRSFCSAAMKGKINSQLNRDSLLRMLIVFTSRKASNRNRYSKSQRRNVQKTFEIESADLEEQAPSQSPAEVAIDFLDACDVMFSKLDDPLLKEICWMKMEGYEDKEIAEKLGKSTRTIQRKCEVIRRNWKKVSDEDLSDSE